MSHMCVAAITNHMKQRKVGVGEGAGHQFNPDTSTVKQSAEGGLGSSASRPPNRHLVVSLKINGLLRLDAAHKDRSSFIVTLKLNLFSGWCFSHWITLNNHENANKAELFQFFLQSLQVNAGKTRAKQDQLASGLCPQLPHAASGHRCYKHSAGFCRFPS